MPERIVFDTDILIDAVREDEDALQTLDEAGARSQPTTSVITEMEMVVGCRNKAELSDLQTFLRRFTVVPLSEFISDRAVELLREYRLSHGLLIPDALIAATVQVLGASLISKNRRDYRFIDGLKLLPYPGSFA